MATTIDWTQFEAFGGTLKRETIVDEQYGPVSDSNGGISALKKPDLKSIRRSIGKFKKWIDLLRDSAPEALEHIFGPFKDSAKEVLQTFFPGDGTVLRVRDKEIAGQERDADPLNVKFGASSPVQELELVDAPSALAYLFSVAIPPPNPTWNDYYLPMLILLSKCLYLGFIDSSEDAGSKPLKYKERLTGVPMMACIMYTERGDRDYNRYMFGSTFAVRAKSVGPGRSLTDKQQVLLDSWRRRLMNRTLKSPDPFSPFTRLAPLFLNQLCGDLYIRLVGNKTFNQSATIAFETIKVLQMALTPGPAEEIERRSLYAIVEFKEKIEVSLVAAIQGRFNSTYYEKEYRSQLRFLLNDFLELTIIPKLFPKRASANDGFDLANQKPEPATDKYLVAKKIAMESFWSTAVGAITKEIDHLLWDVELDILTPNCSVWGRCAETYCFSCILYVETSLQNLLIGLLG
ncbi:uncharacterized protein N7479_000700 [Penicillium vulpinum]|uniref:uncharacterized protein n=1 Tax=Penicillium vulpinum TaxID=29845 RepID=UPI00254989F8|nr:uncharacterized protein N7479_000700 [Penicillium vulpinum]KAJ5970782.1 hypothetical protein N7479_000700 [Penicillium vulpinum]